MPAVEPGEHRAGAVGNEDATDTLVRPGIEQGADLLVGQVAGGRPEVGGRLAAVELDRVGPGAADGVERGAVGVEENGDRASAPGGSGR